MRTERSMRIEAVGRLWMPMCKAGFEKTYRIGKGPFEIDVTSLGDAESQMSRDTSDFSSVDDYRITYTVTRTYPNPDGPGVVKHSRSLIARDWEDEDSENTLIDCLHPWDEDEG